MSRLKKLGDHQWLPYLALILGFGGTAAVVTARVSQSYVASRRRETLALPDSAKLALMRFRPGTHLVAYVLVSTDCGFCAEPRVHRALGTIRSGMMRAYAHRFADVSVVGVNIDPDLKGGVEFLEGMGRDSFDEISVGRSWANETLGHLVWRDRVADAMIPQVVVFARSVQATLQPLTVAMGTDSLLIHLRGRDELLDWERRGFPLVR